ncbi:MAG: TolC family protein, partial [Verrucomicrobiota bacterium]
VDLAEVYLEIIRTRSQVTLAESNVRNHQRMRDLLKERANAGGSRADVSLVQGRLGLAVSQLATQKLAYQTAEARFERLVGRKPATMINPGIPRISGSQASIDLSNNFNYLAAAEALEGAEHRANAMKGLYGPRIYIEGRGTAGIDTIGIRGDDNEVSAQLTGTWDLYRGGYNRSMNYREHFQVGKFEELKRAADLERRYELDLIWQERAGSQATITALRKYADELSQVTGDYEDQFKVGRQELMNILDVQSEAYTARSRLLDAEFDYNTSAYRVLGVQGLATYTILGPDGCSRAFSKNPKEPLLASTEGETVEPDNRVPVTQADLMTGRFDTDGPAAEYEDLSQRYYEERAQLPIQPEEDARPRGRFFRALQRNDEEHKPGSGRRGALFK